MKLLLQDTLPDDLMAALRAVGQIEILGLGASEAKLREALRGADAFLGSSEVRIENDVIDSCPKLKVISISGSGYDNIDISHATRRGVLVCHAPGVANGAVADVTFALILNLARRIRENEN